MTNAEAERVLLGPTEREILMDMFNEITTAIEDDRLVNWHVGVTREPPSFTRYVTYNIRIKK